MLNRYQITVVITTLFWLVACDPLAKPETMMDEYVKRLGHVLDVEPKYSDLIHIERLPRPRDRKLSIPETDINMLDFLALYGCELQFVVGEKNSIMGRVMQPLNSLRYELRFIEAARACLPKIDNEKLKRKVLKAIETKQHSLSLFIWNATWGTDEIANLLSLSNGLYQPEQSQHEISKYTNDVNYLVDVIRKLQNGEYSQELLYMGEVQQSWQYGSRAGQLQNSGKLLVTRLEDATKILKQRTHQKPLCAQGKPNNQARVLESMFFSVYIAKVQPYMAHVNRGAEQLFEALAELAQIQQEVMPDDFQSYYDNSLRWNNDHGLWGEYQQRVEEHTKAWQDLLEQCGLRPVAE